MYVAKQQLATRGRILNGMAVSDDDEWEVAEGVADPGGVADQGGVSPQDYRVPEMEEAEHMSHSELVVSTSLHPIPSRILAADVVREENEPQGKPLR